MKCTTRPAPRAARGAKPRSALLNRVQRALNIRRMGPVRLHDYLVPETPSTELTS